MKSDSEEIKLDDDSLAFLIAEVAAMVESQQSLSKAMIHLDDPLLGRLGRAVRSIRSELDQGKSISEAFGVLSGRHDLAVKAALAMMVQMRSSVPLYALVDLIREHTSRRRQLRIAAVEPMINSLIAAVIFLLILPWMVVSLSGIGLISMGEGVGEPGIVNLILGEAFYAVISIVAVCLALLAVVCGFWGKVSRGGLVDHDYGVFCDWIALQLMTPLSKGQNHGQLSDASRVDIATGLEQAADIVGLNFSQQWRQVADQIRMGSVSLEDLRIPAGCPAPLKECVRQLVSGNFVPDRVTMDLVSLSRLYRNAAAKKQNRYLKSVPRFLSWFLMILLIMTLLKLILMPLVESLRGMVV